MLLEAIEDAGFEGEVVQQGDSNTVTLQVEGMTCGSCSSAVQNAVASQKGVVSAAVNLLAKRAEVRCCAFSLFSCRISEVQKEQKEHKSCKCIVSVVCKSMCNSMLMQSSHV